MKRIKWLITHVGQVRITYHTADYHVRVGDNDEFVAPELEQAVGKATFFYKDQLEADGRKIVERLTQLIEALP